MSAHNNSTNVLKDCCDVESETVSETNGKGVEGSALHVTRDEAGLNSLLAGYSSSNFDSTNSSTSTSFSTTSQGSPSPIHLINCDNIKIWTDQSAQLEAHSMQDYESYPCNRLEQQNDCSVGVFNSFLPRCGKKLRPQKSSQNFFDEGGISTLDLSTSSMASQDHLSGESGGVSELAGSPKDPPNTTKQQSTSPVKNSQSLTSFLQMGQLSRNNTQLEKENAHFRISEAIISAMEHMKWSKMTSAEAAGRNEEVATDWLQADQVPQDLNEQVARSVSTGETCLAAEVVGLSLISKFADKDLPKMSELKWLVSEEDAPQKLLPLPRISSQGAQGENPDENIILPVTRGTRYWAPPRPQIIFTEPNPCPTRKELMQKQNNRCAGCGMRIAPQYMHSFRYCYYLAKYLCTGCHRNQISVTPAKILQAWDFKSYPVSVFAYHLLEQMYTYPLFYVPDLNPALYVQQKALSSARRKRIQLRFIRDFIRLCRFAHEEQQYFADIPEYITNDVDMWSLSDFVDVWNKSFVRLIEHRIEMCERHIVECVLCSARGFICEYCAKPQVIYPWQSRIYRCNQCGMCYHQSCWKSMLQTCCKCQRIMKRRNEIASTSGVDDN